MKSKPRCTMKPYPLIKGRNWVIDHNRLNGVYFFVPEEVKNECTVKNGEHKEKTVPKDDKKALLLLLLHLQRKFTYPLRLVFNEQHKKRHEKMVIYLFVGKNTNRTNPRKNPLLVKFQKKTQ